MAEALWVLDGVREAVCLVEGAGDGDGRGCVHAAPVANRVKYLHKRKVQHVALC